MTPFRPGIVVAVGMLLAACVGMQAVSASPATKPPNVVFFLADDLGWSDVGFHGSEIKTPNIDKLAASGAKLDAFYVQPVCSPTRAALMTGRYPMRHGLQVGVVRPWAQYGLPLEERTLPQALKTAGYSTAIVGKWHLGHFQPEYLPTRRGFDMQYGHFNGALDYFTHIRDGGFDWHRNDQENRDEGYTTTLIGYEAVRIVEKHDSSKPLFLYIPFNAPHAPLQALEEDLKSYEAITDKKRRPYAAMVQQLDQQVGRVVAAIEKRGLRDNTLFIFSSDNGGPLGSGATNRGLRAGKGTLYEGGTRVSACVSWSGHIKPGTTVTEPFHMVDWFPTLLKLAGVTGESKLPLDGRDIWPVLTEGKPTPHDAILLNTTPKNGAIRMGDWKLVLNGNATVMDSEEEKPADDAKKAGKGKKKAAEAGERVELFNLTQDREEKNNLAEANPEKVKQLRARLDTFAKEAIPPKSEAKAPGFKSPRVWGQAD
ncbi:MAG TPA: arylsulfatase [Roseimicrobium sp.]|nr:arylsulfatase [Roseimicrobium sp.]